MNNDGTLATAYEIFYGATNFQRDLPTPSAMTFHESPKDSIISLPARPTQLRRVSELIDPRDLMRTSQESLHSQDSRGKPRPAGHSQSYPASQKYREKKLPKIVQSPSGTALGAVEFANRPDRPLAMRERQESIIRAMEKRGEEAMARQAMEAELNEKQARKGSTGSTWSGSERKGSSAGSSAFEKARIEDGAKAYQQRCDARVKKSRRGLGCLSCFGKQDD